MERTDYKKVSFCERKIAYQHERILTAKRLRGIGPGTFWLDEAAVDKYIAEIENYIIALNERIKYLNSHQP